MKKEEVLQKIEAAGIVPVIRTGNEAAAENLVEAIHAGGIEVFEITLSVPNAARVIERLTRKFAARMLIGAGTVLSVEQAESCLAAGAQFIVSPVLNREIVQLCLSREVAVFPAGLTPNEIFAASQAGADAVKVFPANSMGGAKYLKSLKAVFPQIKLMPTGGVNLETIADFFRAGAYAVGVGSELADAKVLNEKGAAEIIRRAREFVEKFNETKDHSAATIK